MNWSRERDNEWSVSPRPVLSTAFTYHNITTGSPDVLCSMFRRRFVYTGTVQNVSIPECYARQKSILGEAKGIECHIENGERDTENVRL